MIENRFIEAARSGKSDFWRYLLSFLLVAFLFLSGGIFAAIVLLVTGRTDLLALPPELFLLINLAPFFFVLVGLGIALPIFHKRSPLTLVNPEQRFAIRPFLVSAAAWLFVNGLADLALSFLQPGNYVFSFDPARFLPWLIAAVLLLPFQCAAEELFFRGYLTQGVGLAGGFWLAWLVPSAIFGLMHWVNPEVLAYGPLLTLPIYIGTGLLLGWVTLRSEGIEMALGLHIANNLYSALLATFPSSVLPAQALFRIQEYHALAVLVAFLATVLVYLVVMGWFGRRYFRHGLFGNL